MSLAEVKNNVPTLSRDKEAIQGVANRLELIKFTAEVQSRIKDEINSDFVLAKLSEEDKIAIIEITSNAFFSKRLVQQIQIKHLQNGNTMEKVEMQRINQLGHQLFQIYMVRLLMTSIMNRNKDRNYIVDKLTGVVDDIEKEDKQEEEKEGALTKIMKKLKKNKKQEVKEMNAE